MITIRLWRKAALRKGKIRRDMAASEGVSHSRQAERKALQGMRIISWHVWKVDDDVAASLQPYAHSRIVFV